MSKKTPGIKIPYFRAEQYPIVEGFRCVEILIPDDISFMALLAGLVKLPGRSFNWQGEDEQRYALAQMWRNAYDATDWEGCMDCESLIACLQPLFDALQAQMDELQETVEEVQATQNNNATEQRGLTQSTVENELCGAATGIVEAMDATNRQTYAETEAGSVDNVFELVQRFLSAIPVFGSLPFDELFGLVNWLFENQVLEYGVDYDIIKDQMICDLKCFVQANDNEFTWDVWADWLDYVGMTYPDNRAAGLFSRFSPTRQTWINQIAAALNKDASLQSYFDSLSTAWEGGLLNPAECDCECNIEWEHEIRFDGADMPDGWTIPAGLGTHVSGQGVRADGVSGGTITARVEFTPAFGFQVVSWLTEFSPVSAGSFSQIFSPASDGSAYTFNFDFLAGAETEQPATGLPAEFANSQFNGGVVFNDTGSTNYLKAFTIAGFGFDPFA